jgi:hypothetical protein
VYTDCGGHSHPWSFTYYINDDKSPLGTCAGGGPVAINVANVACIENIPCPTTYDFSAKVEEMLMAGNIFDVCSGDDLIVTLDSWTELWQCSDADGDGVYTYGRTFYFHIADQCGNEFPDLCSVTYSGVCQPLKTFTQEAWGISGDAPGISVSAATTDLQVIQTLLSTGSLVVGGGNRSLTINQAQCVVDLLPGTGGPNKLSNCHQANCSGCNAMSNGGLKNSLAANAIALTLNMRFNVQYNGLTMTNVRNQGLGCVDLHPCIYFCTDGVGCELRIFDAAGTAYKYPYTVGGLLDLSNLYLGGNLVLSGGQSVLYSTALNQSLINVNAYWAGGVTPTSCAPEAGVGGSGDLGARSEGFRFDAVKHLEKTELFWVHNGDYLVNEYLVERSTDGIVFGEINAMPSDKDTKADVYKCYDLEPVVGNNYYRVKLRNEDGSTTYSEVRVVAFGDIKGFTLFPNPANGQTRIDLGSIMGKQADIHIYNNLGVRMKVYHLEEVSEQYFQMDLKDLHEGHYLVWIKAEGRREVTKQLVIGRLEP